MSGLGSTAIARQPLYFCIPRLERELSTASLRYRRRSALVDVTDRPRAIKQAPKPQEPVLVRQRFEQCRRFDRTLLHGRHPSGIESCADWWYLLRSDERIE